MNGERARAQTVEVHVGQGTTLERLFDYWFFWYGGGQEFYFKLDNYNRVRHHCLIYFFVLWRLVVANIKSAVKRARQNIKLRQRNTSARSAFRTYVKNVVKAVELKDKEAASKAFSAAQPVIDKAVSKGLIHLNKASRIKSRLSAKIKGIAA